MHPLLERLQTLGEASGPRAGRGRTRAETPAFSFSFCTQGRLPGDALSVEVDGFGPLAQPLPAEHAGALLAGSTPAAFGRRDKTLLDRRVRDTGRIDADRITLRWQDGAFTALQQAAASALGLPGVEARLHDGLVYGPGQFFKPHQDTAKTPGMVGTLVLVWPSAHIGGTLRVTHGGQELQLPSQQLGGTEIRWFAFFADCRHEVLPVDEGWRIALSFDLVLPAGAGPVADAAPDAELVDALRAQFGLPDQPGTRPWALLLDHEYSEHGLRWPLLKGADRPRAEALRSAARSLGLTVHLALLELHEHWTAVPGGRRGGATHGMVPDELIDTEFSFDFWVDAGDAVAAPAGLPLRLEDTVCFVESGAEHLVDEEYEGYMGNYGETIDYWYRRAALVIRTPLGEAADRFRNDFDAALDDAVRLGESPGGGARLVPLLAAAGGTLAFRARDAGRALLPAYARLAAVLPDDTARALMSPLSPFDWQPADAPVLATLQQRRGPAWLVAWIGAAASPREADTPNGRVWKSPLAEVVQACRAAGLDEDVLRCWLQRHRDALQQAAAWAGGPLAQAQLRAVQQRLLQQACELAAALRQLPAAEAERDGLAADVAAAPHVFPPATLAPLVRALGQPAESPLHATVRTLLQARLARPARAADDHGLRDLAWRCRCTDCAAIAAWAAAPGAQPLVLPMIEDRRRHAEASIQATTDLLAFETVRSGRPYKLLLRKPSDLRAREEADRAAWAKALASLDVAPPMPSG